MKAIVSVTIFDPETVAEGSDYDAGKNGLPPKGMPHWSSPTEVVRLEVLIWTRGGLEMGKRHKPEEIVSKLRHVDVFTSQGANVADAIRQIRVTQLTYYLYGRLSRCKSILN